jgi:hypothetical protein
VAALHPLAVDADALAHAVVARRLRRCAQMRVTPVMAGRLMRAVMMAPMVMSRPRRRLAVAAMVVGRCCGRRFGVVAMVVDPRLS